MLRTEVNMQSEVSLTLAYQSSEVGSQLRVECAMMTDASFSESNGEACRRISHREVV